MYDNVLNQIEENLTDILLTPKERYVYLAIKRKNKTQRQIASELHISQSTVSRHYTVACDKLTPVLNVVLTALKNHATYYLEF